MAGPEAADGSKDPRAGGPSLKRNLQWVLLLRLLLAVFFLVLTLVAQSRRTGDLLSAHLQPLYFFSCILLIFTIITAMSLKQVRHLRRFAYFQLFFDVEAVTFLIYISGGVDSPFSFLYMPVIISAALLLYRRGSLLTASACALSYGVLLDMQYFEWISPLQIVAQVKYDGDNGSYLHRLFMNIAGFYLVGFVSGYLAESLQKSRQEIRKQKENILQLEALHKNIVHSINSGLITIDMKGDVVFFNRAVEDILGLLPEQLQGRPIKGIMPHLVVPSPEQEPEPGKDPLRPLNRMELTYRHPSGEELCLGYSVSRLQKESGDLYAWIIVFQDLTLMKRLERHMRHVEHLAFAGKVAAEIAHEIKNPLAAMSGAVQMLQSDVRDSPFQSRLMGIVSREIDRIDAMVTDFLWLSKGMQKPERKEPVAVCGTIQEIVALLRVQGKAGASHRIRTLFDCEPVLLLDPHQLRQILWNLLENALEAMPEGGDLTIRVGHSGGRRSSGAELRVDVWDTGPGIAEEVRDKIFEPFHTTKEKGVGLGLSIVYQLVRNSDGRIEVFDPPGGGALFSIFFPISSTLPIAKNP